MPQRCWVATATGHYWLDFALGTQVCQCMVDTGLVDPRGLVGFEVAPRMYDGLKQAGQLTHFLNRSFRRSSGRLHTSEIGLTTAQLLDPLGSQPIGPAVSLYIGRGVRGLPDRVGSAFFHRLIGCRVIWHLPTRTWCVEYP